MRRTRRNSRYWSSESEDEWNSLVDESNIKKHDIDVILPDLPDIDDKATLKVIKARNKKLISARLKKVNSFIDDIYKIWPRATSQDIYIAFELCNFEKEKTLEYCTQSDFREKVKNERLERITSKNSNKTISRASHNFTPFYSDGWTKEEIDIFINLIQNHSFMKNWDALKEYIPTKNQGQLKKLYNFVTDSSQKSQSSQAHQQIGHIASLTFIKNGHEFQVGSVLSKVDKMSMLNPIPGFIDPITCNPMTVPALSPDGYVLDYSTWTKLIKEKKGNPYTQLQIISKRSLTILTFENFSQYKSSIVNWDEIKPPGYADEK